MKTILIIWFCCLFFITGLTSHAVIVWGGRDENAAQAGAGWDYVGSVGSASGVYVGEYGGEHWVMTAAHVGAHNFVHNGQSYAALDTQGYKVGDYDMILYRINVTNDTPLSQLSNLKLADAHSGIGVGSQVVVIGNGGGTQGELQTWYVDTTDEMEYKWYTDPSAGTWDSTIQGYKYLNGNTKSWGVNSITGVDYEIVTNYSSGTDYIGVTFGTSPGSAQGVPFDSGGGFFYYNEVTGEWELAGISGYINAWDSQPQDTAIQGNMTFASPIAPNLEAIYEIMGVAIPEPATGLLTVMATCTMAFRRRRVGRS